MFWEHFFSFTCASIILTSHSLMWANISFHFATMLNSYATNFLFHSNHAVCPSLHMCADLKCFYFICSTGFAFWSRFANCNYHCSWFVAQINDGFSDIFVRLLVLIFRLCKFKENYSAIFVDSYNLCRAKHKSSHDSGTLEIIWLNSWL